MVNQEILSASQAEDEITVWLGRLSQGDSRAPHAIWRAYFDRLVRLARGKLDAACRRAADEEDVALSAMQSFYRGVAEGRFSAIEDRDALWRLLVTITTHKAFHQLRAQRTAKRGGGRVRGESAFVGRFDAARDDAGIEQVLGREPTPEFAQEVAENCNRLLDSLEDKSLRTVADLKLQGYTNEEIGLRLECATRTVERKLERIRDHWTTLV